MLAKIKEFHHKHHAFISFVLKTFLNFLVIIGNLNMKQPIFLYLSIMYIIISLVLLCICFKKPKFIDVSSFYVALSMVLMTSEFDLYSRKVQENFERNIIIYLMLVILNEKYKNLMANIILLFSFFIYFEVRNGENSGIYFITSFGIFLGLLIYVYQYWMIEYNMKNEKQLALENHEYILLYNSIIKNYPSALISFELIKTNNTSNSSYNLKFSNEIAKKEFKIYDNENLNQLFEDIHLNTTNLFDFDSLPDYSPGSKNLKKHILESIILTDTYGEQDPIKEKCLRTPKIKKFLTTYKKKIPMGSNGLIYEEIESKYRICLIKFYHNGKLIFLLNLEDIHLEEEISHLKELDKSKDEMLASITHDLRSPLSSMLKCIEFAKDSKNLLENHQNLELATSSGMMLMNLINDILDYSLMKKGKFKLNFSFFPLEKVINETVDMMKVQGNLKNISILTINKCRKYLSLYSDFIRIKQVLVNLISNSLKFTKGGGQIILEITQTSDPKLILFSVIDNGVGIKAEIIPKLCKPFHSYDYGGCYNKQGIGLGLHICTNIISQLGPEKQLKIESVYEKGSKFSFILFVNCSFHSELFIADPVKRSIGNSIDSFPFLKEIFSEHSSQKNLPYFFSGNSDIHKDDVLININDSESNSDSELSHSFEANLISKVLKKNIIKRSISNIEQIYKTKDLINDPKFSKECTIHILLADDDVFTMMLMKKMIMKFSQEHDVIKMKVDTVYNGEEALLLFEQNNKPSNLTPYDIILLDCVMPIKDGFATAQDLKRLINDRNYIKCPIIGCTAWHDSTRCLNNGMDEILIKPIEIYKLFEIFTQIYLNKFKPL